MKARERIKFVKLFNKKIKEGIALVLTLDSSAEFQGIRRRIFVAMDINETIFLDKVGPFLINYADIIRSKETNAEEVLATTSLNEEIRRVDGVDEKETDLFMELFHKIYNIADLETRVKSQNVIAEMLEIYECYKSMC